MKLPNSKKSSRAAAAPAPAPPAPPRKDNIFARANSGLDAFEGGGGYQQAPSAAPTQQQGLGGQGGFDAFGNGGGGKSLAQQQQQQEQGMWEDGASMNDGYDEEASFRDIEDAPVNLKDRVHGTMYMKMTRGKRRRRTGVCGIWDENLKSGKGGYQPTEAQKKKKLEKQKVRERRGGGNEEDFRGFHSLVTPHPTPHRSPPHPLFARPTRRLTTPRRRT